MHTREQAERVLQKFQAVVPVREFKITYNAPRCATSLKVVLDERLTEAQCRALRNLYPRPSYDEPLRMCG